MDDDEDEERTKCQICMSGCKQMTTFALSHAGLLALVILYCCIGAAIFEKLESENELKVKRNMTLIRQNVSHDLWDMTDKALYINPNIWLKNATLKLELFEIELINAMRHKGWDGIEGENVQSWTYLGSLFYSIIVITTIGYGHIAPKTMWGKIVTIFYAIIGIPLMVICWSHIGDFLANAFRCLYWKVCCYICTKNPRPRRPPPSRAGSRRSFRPTSAAGGSMRMKSRSIRRSQRASNRSADSALSQDSVASDPGIAYKATKSMAEPQSPTYPQPQQYASTLPRAAHSQSQSQQQPGWFQRTTKSAEPEILLTPQSLKNLPVLYNRYAEDIPPKHGRGIITTQPLGPAETTEDDEEDSELSRPNKSMLSRSRMRSVPPETIYGQSRIDEDLECYFNEDEDDYGYDEDYDRGGGYYGERRSGGDRRQVPIWLCAFLVVGYIVAGGFIFSSWENWEYLDSAYFCFITLTTIGFGDFVPSQKNKEDEVTSIALCSLYLLFGIALLAMSFNLVQEQVINAFKELAMRLGIIPVEDEEQY